MVDKKHLKDEFDVDNLEDRKRKKFLRNRKQRDIEESEFDEMLDEVLDDDNLYHILKKLKD